MWPAKVVTKALRLVWSLKPVNAPSLIAVRGEASVAAAV